MSRHASKNRQVSAPALVLRGIVSRQRVVEAKIVQTLHGVRATIRRRAGIGLVRKPCGEDRPSTVKTLQRLAASPGSLCGASFCSLQAPTSHGPWATSLQSPFGSAHFPSAPVSAPVSESLPGAPSCPPVTYSSEHDFGVLCCASFCPRIGQSRG